MNKTNIEIGAGCGRFGELFYPTCVITDCDSEITIRCPDNCIEIFCHAWEVPYPENSFKRVIVCNPWEYGFTKSGKGVEILLEFTRILVPKGVITIIGSTRNKYCAPWNIRKILSKVQETSPIVYTLNVESIDPAIEYPGFEFRNTSGDIIVPKSRTEIHVSK